MNNICIPDKYYSKIGKYLALAYLVVASIILFMWIFPGRGPGSLSSINGLHCGGGLLSNLCSHAYPIQDPHHGYLQTLIFLFPIILSTFLLYIIYPNYPHSEHVNPVYANFYSYILWNLPIWLVIMAINALIFYVIGLGITKFKKKYFDKTSSCS